MEGERAPIWGWVDRASPPRAGVPAGETAAGVAGRRRERHAFGGISHPGGPTTLRFIF